MFNLNPVTVVLRYNLLIAVVVVSFSIGLPWLAILALPIFLSTILGVSFTKKTKKKTLHNKRILLPVRERLNKKAG